MELSASLFMNECDGDPADKIKEVQQLISGSQEEFQSVRIVFLAAVGATVCKRLDVLLRPIANVSLSDRDIKIKKR